MPLTNEKPAAEAEETKPVEVPHEEDPAANPPARDEEGNELPPKEEAEEKSAEEPAKPVKRVETAQERISAAIRKQRTAEKRYYEVRERNIALEQRLTALETAVTGKSEHAALPNGAPDPSKYQYGELDSQYIRALARFEAVQEVKQAETARERAQKEAETAQKLQEFETQKAEFAAKGSEKYDDFDEIVIENAASPENPSGWPLSQLLGSLLLTSDLGTDIAYQLASDIKEATKVYRMPAGQQAAWFAQKVGELSAQTPGASAKAVKVTKAPPPVKPVRGSGSSTAVRPDTDDFAAFEAAYGWRRQKQS